eukprot:jgi/Mesvir1/5008/Mv13895-RA.1
MNEAHGADVLWSLSSEPFIGIDRRLFEKKLREAGHYCVEVWTPRSLPGTELSLQCSLVVHDAAGRLLKGGSRATGGGHPPLRDEGPPRGSLLGGSLTTLTPHATPQNHLGPSLGKGLDASTGGSSSATSSIHRFSPRESSQHGRASSASSASAPTPAVPVVNACPRPVPANHHPRGGPQADIPAPASSSPRHAIHPHQPQHASLAFPATALVRATTAESAQDSTGALDPRGASGGGGDGPSAIGHASSAHGSSWVAGPTAAPSGSSLRGEDANLARSPRLYLLGSPSPSPGSSSLRRRPLSAGDTATLRHDNTTSALSAGASSLSATSLPSGLGLSAQQRSRMARHAQVATSVRDAGGRRRPHSARAASDSPDPSREASMEHSFLEDDDSEGEGGDEEEEDEEDATGMPSMGGFGARRKHAYPRAADYFIPLARVMRPGADPADTGQRANGAWSAVDNRAEASQRGNVGRDANRAGIPVDNSEDVGDGLGGDASVTSEGHRDAGYWRGSRNGGGARNGGGEGAETEEDEDGDGEGDEDAGASGYGQVSLGGGHIVAVPRWQEEFVVASESLPVTLEIRMENFVRVGVLRVSARLVRRPAPPQLPAPTEGRAGLVSGSLPWSPRLVWRASELFVRGHRRGYQIQVGPGSYLVSVGAAGKKGASSSTLICECTLRSGDGSLLHRASSEEQEGDGTGGKGADKGSGDKDNGMGVSSGNSMPWANHFDVPPHTGPAQLDLRVTSRARIGLVRVTAAVHAVPPGTLASSAAAAIAAAAAVRDDATTKGDATRDDLTSHGTAGDERMRDGTAIDERMRGDSTGNDARSGDVMRDGAGRDGGRVANASSDGAREIIHGSDDLPSPVHVKLDKGAPSTNSAASAGASGAHCQKTGATGPTASTGEDRQEAAGSIITPRGTDPMDGGASSPASSSPLPRPQRPFSGRDATPGPPNTVSVSAGSVLATTGSPSRPLPAGGSPRPGPERTGLAAITMVTVTNPDTPSASPSSSRPTSARSFRQPLTTATSGERSPGPPPSSLRDAGPGAAPLLTNPGPSSNTGGVHRGGGAAPGNGHDGSVTSGVKNGSSVREGSGSKGMEQGRDASIRAGDARASDANGAHVSLRTRQASPTQSPRDSVGQVGPLSSPMDAVPVPPSPPLRAAVQQEPSPRARGRVASIIRVSAAGASSPRSYLGRQRPPVGGDAGDGVGERGASGEES